MLTEEALERARENASRMLHGGPFPDPLADGLAQALSRLPYRMFRPRRTSPTVEAARADKARSRGGT